MRDWRKLRISSFVWAFCYQCREGLTHAPRFPLLGLEFYSTQRKLFPQYSKFTSYAVKHCRTLALYDCAARTLLVLSPMETQADWEYAAYLMDTYYDDPKL